MSHYLAATWRAVYDRAKADTGTGGLFNVTTPLVSAISNQTGYQGNYTVAAIAVPYLVYTVTGADVVDGFTTAVRDVAFQIWAIVPSHETGSVDGGAVTANIINRLEGDWWDQATGVPSFGFDRHLPTMSGTTWLPSIFELRRWRDGSTDDGVITTILDFNIRISKQEG